jgi:hypothetical protein
MGLVIAFGSPDLRKTCNSPARAKRELGAETASLLQGRLADMEAVECASELIEVGLGIADCVEDPAVLRFRLAEGVYLRCKVNHKLIPMNGDTVDWSRVTRLQVIGIGSDQ